MNFAKTLSTLDTIILRKYKRHLTPVEIAILTGVWQDETYESISARSDGRYSVNYLKRDIGPKLWKLLSEVLETTVNKKNFKAVLEDAFSKYPKIAQADPELIEDKHLINAALQAPSDLSTDKTTSPKLTIDRWGDVVDISEFYGREHELAHLENWITEEHCRIVALLGFGGVGKSAMAARLVKQIDHKFEFIFWRSLSYTPSPEDLLDGLISSIPSSNTEKGSDLLGYEGKISLLMSFLRQHSCLLVLDGVEAVLRERGRAGQYCQGCEKYSALIRRVGEEEHKSCLILVGREKPNDISLMEGEKLFVRSFRLEGLLESDAKEILKSKGFQVSEQEQDWSELIRRYSSNPYALKNTATTIYELFNQNVSSFLEQDKTLFGKVYDLIEEQINRLSNSERAIVNWLSLKPEGASIQEIREAVFSSETQRKFISSLKSLKDRSIIVEQNSKFKVQTILYEYLVDKLVDQLYSEIIENDEQNFNTSNLALNNYPIVELALKDIAPNSDSPSSIENIADPLLKRLYLWYGGKKEVENRLKTTVSFLGKHFPLRIRHAVNNLVLLLKRSQSQSSNDEESLQQFYLPSSDQNVIDFVQNMGDVLSIAYSKDKQFLAMGDTGGQIHLWQISQDRSQLRNHIHWQGHQSWIRTLTFSPDNSILVTGGNDYTIKFWLVKSGQIGECIEIFNEKEWVRSIAFSPDGKLFAAASDDFLVKLWRVDFEGEKPKFTSLDPLSNDGHAGRVRAIAFHPTKPWLASCSDDKQVKIWNCETLECVTLGEHEDRVRTVAFSPDGRTLASGGDDRTVILWNIDNFGENPKKIGEPKALREHSNKVRTVAFSEDGRWFSSGGDDCQVNVWNTENYDFKIRLELNGERNPGRVHCLQFSSDNTGLVCSSDIQVVRLWNVQNRQVLKMLRGRTNSVQSTLFIDEQTLATAHDDCTIKIWNLAQKSCSKILTNHTGRVGSLSVAGKILVSCSSDDSSAILWDVSASRSLQSIEASPTSRHEVRCAAISPSRQMLAVAGDDACIKVWQIRNDEIQNETKATLRDHEGWIRAVAFSPDSQLLASGGDDQMIRIWDMSSMQWGASTIQPKAVWKKGHIHRIRCLVFSPDARVLASSSDDGSIKLWDVAHGECFKRLAAKKALGICSIAFSPDGRFLASGSDDSIVRIWKIDNGKFEELPERHSMGILSVAFSPSGRTLVSSSLDGEIRSWDFETKKSWMLAS